MPLGLNREVFVTGAVTGPGGAQDRSPHVPRVIAASAVVAARAAAAVRLHVRDPATGRRRRRSTQGRLWHARSLADEGLRPGPGLVQLCMGVPRGAPDDLGAFLAMAANAPAGRAFSAFGLGRHQMRHVAASVLAGGQARVGLEDDLWLDRGLLATNEALAGRAVGIVERMGARVVGPAEVRERLGLVKRAPLGLAA